MIIDFSNPWVFFVWYFITAGILFASYKTKIAKLCLIPVCYFLLILWISLQHPEWIANFKIHRFFNFLGLIVSVPFLVVMDEVETRRKVISQVFKNKYKKNKDKEEDEDDSDTSKGA